MVFRVSAQFGQSSCSGGPCGWMGADLAFSHYYNHTGGEEHLVCVMPQKSANRMMSFHHNVSGIGASETGGWRG